MNEKMHQQIRRALNALASDAEPDIRTARLALYELLAMVQTR